MTTSTTRGGPELAAAKHAAHQAIHALHHQQLATAHLIRRVALEQLAPQLEQLAAAETAAREAAAAVKSLGGTPAAVDAPADRIAAKWGAPYGEAIAALRHVHEHEAAIQAGHDARAVR
jgi:hypothetical protein